MCNRPAIDGLSSKGLPRRLNRTSGQHPPTAGMSQDNVRSGQGMRPKPPHLHFDRLMEAVTTQGGGEPGEPPVERATPAGCRDGASRAALSARQANGGDRRGEVIVGNKGAGLKRAGERRAGASDDTGRADWRQRDWRDSAERPRASATPREIMASAVRELPSLTNTLQHGNWKPVKTPVGTSSLLLTPRAPEAARPASAHTTKASGAPSVRPQSARPKYHSQYADGPEQRGQAPAAAPRRVANVASDVQATRIPAGGFGAGTESQPTSGETSAAAQLMASGNGSAMLRVVQQLCSLGHSSGIDEVIARTRALMKESLGCEGSSVFLVLGKGRSLVCNSISNPELPANSSGVVGRVAQGLSEVVNVPQEENCPFFDHRVDRDPELRSRVGQGLLAQGVYSSAGSLLSVILAVGKLHDSSFSEVDETVLKMIAVQLGMVLQLCKDTRKKENHLQAREIEIRFANALNECKTADSVLALAKQYFKEKTGATKVVFFDLELFSSALLDEESVDSSREQPVDTAKRAFKSGHAFVIEDLSVHEQYSRQRKEHDFAKSILSIPMRLGIQGKILGVIQGRHGDAFYFTRAQADVMEPMFCMMAQVLERSQLADNARRLHTKLLKVISSREIRDSIFSSEEVAREVLGAQSACVFVLNQASGRIWTEHSTSSGRDEFDAGVGIVGECLRHNAFMQLPDALKDPRYFDPVDGAKSMNLGNHHRPMILAPIHAMEHKKVLGVLVVCRDGKQSFSSTDANFATVIASTLAATFQICMEHEIYEVALKDSRNMIRLASSLHHELVIPDLALATIKGAMEALRATECVVLLRCQTRANEDVVGKDDQMRKVRLRKFSLLEGQLEDDVVQWDDAVIEQSLIKGLMVNVTSQRMLNALGYKRLHKMMAITGNKTLASEVDRDPDELLLGPTMCGPLFTGLDRGHVFGVIQVRRPVKSEVFQASEEQKFRYFCQHASSAFSSTFERARLLGLIERYKGDSNRQNILSTFLDTIHDSTDFWAVVQNIVKASKALADCSGASLYIIENPIAAFGGCLAQDREIQGEHFITQVRIGTEIHEKKVDIHFGIPGEVRRRGAAVLVNDPSTSDFFDAQVDDPWSKGGGTCRNALGVPIFSKGEAPQVIAVLVLYNSFVQTEHGLDVRNFDSGDEERLRVLTSWIGTFLKQSRVLKVPVDTIHKVLASGLGDSVVQAVASKKTINTSEAMSTETREGQLLDQLAAWEAIAETVKSSAHCQALIAFRLLPGESSCIECIYPAEAAGHRMQIRSGILKQAIESSQIVNVFDSSNDHRISAENDSMSFLNMRWDAGIRREQSPTSARYGDGKLLVRKSFNQGIARVEWSNALVVPMQNTEAGVTGLALAMNKALQKGPFNESDILLLKTLIKMTDLEESFRSTKARLRDALALRRDLIKEAGNIIYKSSNVLLSTEEHVKEALVHLLRVTTANYGAIYMIHPRLEGHCTKYDSEGSVSSEKRTKSLPWGVIDNGSPINIASASDLEASQAVPVKTFGDLRSILAEPLIIDQRIQGVLLVAWKSNGKPFDEHDEQALHDFAVIFGSTRKLLGTVEELVNAMELEMAIPRSTIPALRGMASPT